MVVKVTEATFVISSPSLQLCPPATLPEYVFVGRSNVGKSSLINAITDKKQLAKTSGQPGKTQLLNYFHIDTISDDHDGENSITQSWYLVDVPGYGFAKVTRQERAKWNSMITSYLQGRETISHVFVLIDSRLIPQKLDIECIMQLHTMGKPYSLIYTKSDKVTQKETSQHIKMMMKELHTHHISSPDFYITSAEKRQSTTKVVHAIHEMNIRLSS